MVVAGGGKGIVLVNLARSRTKIYYHITTVGRKSVHYFRFVGHCFEGVVKAREQFFFRSTAVPLSPQG